MEKSGVEDLIDDLKDSVKQMILTQRTQESQKIKVMRKLKQAYESDADTEMQEVRSSMAKTLTKTYRKGEMSVCTKDKATLNINTDTEPYCKKYYSEVPQDMEECIKIDNFCVYCCMNEFGVEAKQDRQECLKACLGKDDAVQKSTWVYEQVPIGKN